MKKFVKRLLFFCLLIVVFIGAGLLIPVPDMKPRHFLYAKTMKDSLLANVHEPRIILVGGSNLSLGINGKQLQDSLKLRPINTATSANLGLFYMMDNTLPYIKEGDVVVVAPEYDQYYGDFAYGGYELLVTTVDIDRPSLKLLNYKQWDNLYGYLPKHAMTRLNPMKYVKQKHSPLYYDTSFNKYGDVTGHWEMKPRFVVPLDIKGDVNDEVFAALKTFEAEVTKRNAKMFVTYPGFQETSFKHNAAKISDVETNLKKMNFTILGTPNDFKFADTSMFDTPYHLGKLATEKRTGKIIEELQPLIGNRESGIGRENSLTIKTRQ